MRRIVAFFTILGALPILLKLVLNGVISLRTAGIALGVILVSLAVGDRALKFILPIFAVTIFVMERTNGSSSQIGAAFAMLVAVAFGLYGIYLMLSGFFPSKESKRDR